MEASCVAAQKVTHVKMKTFLYGKTRYLRNWNQTHTLTLCRFIDYKVSIWVYFLIAITRLEM